MKLKKIALTIASLSAITASPALLAAETLAEAFSEGTVKGNLTCVMKRLTKTMP